MPTSGIARVEITLAIAIVSPLPLKARKFALKELSPTTNRTEGISLDGKNRERRTRGWTL